jgi:hexosaminidase
MFLGAGIIYTAVRADAERTRGTRFETAIRPSMLLGRRRAGFVPDNAARRGLWRDDDGAFYGMQSLRQLVVKENAQVGIRSVEIEDWPHVAFRGIRLYLPGHENIAFCRRFLRDFMALYKFNKVIVEVNASMRLDRHPELNAGWIDFARDLYYTQRYNPLGAHATDQNSAHHDTADGEILEKDEVADLVRYANAQHIEVIPEIPTFTHSYYLLTRHKELGAISGAEWPDIYDPTRPEVYKLVFDVFDEYIEVMKPKMVHIAHDEMFYPVELCIPGRSKDPSELWAGDVRKIHDYLAAKGIRTALYGDHLIESVRGVHRKPYKSKTGWEYNMPGALTPQQVTDLIPKDTLVANWFWHDVRAAEGRGEPNDVKLSDWGFQQIHANFMYNIQNYARPGVIGGAPSSWAATTEYTMGKDLMLDFLGTANLMWSTHWPEEQALSKIVQSMMPDVRRRLSGKVLPSRPAILSNRWRSPRRRMALADLTYPRSRPAAWMTATGTSICRAR